MTKLFLALVLLILPVTAFAQTVPLNTPFTVTADYSDDAPPAVPAAGFRCYLDGVKVGADLGPARVAGTVTCSYPAQTVAGIHAVRISAFNSAGETMSQPLAFAVVAPPTPPPAPSNLKITVTVQIADGKVNVLGVEAAAAP